MYNKEKWNFLLDAPFKITSRCCRIFKKEPFKLYEKETGRKARIVATMAEESLIRKSQWLTFGCNVFDDKSPRSQPLSFWTEQDVLRYIKENNISIASVYGDIVPDMPEECEGQISVEDLGLIPDNRKLKTTGCNRTGCMFCGFGCHLEKEGEGRFERMKQTHPQLYNYIMKPKEEGGLGYKAVIDWINKNGGLNIRY